MEPTRVLAWDAETGRVDWRDVTALSRHRTPETLQRLTTACGRDVTVTADHSVWVLRGGQLHLIHGDAVQEGDALPVPRRVPEPGQTLTHLNTLEVLDGLPFQVSAPYAAEQDSEWRELVEAHYPQPPSKLHAIRHGKKAGRLHIPGARAAIAGGLMTLEESCVSARTADLPAALPLNAPLALLLGHYLAEGHSADRFALISVRDPEIQGQVEEALKALGAGFFRRRDGDFVLGGRVWHELLSRLLGRNAHTKHLPENFAAFPNAFLAGLLRAYFEGDGGVERNAVTAVTASKRLAGEMIEVLLRFGVWTRLREVQKKRPDGTYGTYHKLTISGAENLGHFQSEIGFLSGRKQKLLAEAVEQAGQGNTNVDLIPGVGPRLLAERERAGLSQRDVAERAGCTRTMISAIECGIRAPSAALFRRICTALGIQDAAFTGLADVHWSAIVGAEQTTPQTPFVYDFSVDGFETFLTGRGGLFVHNTYSMAKVIEETGRPALIMAPNKILTAQLASEFREFFPDAAVEFFISYYDYYQPEAYVPGKDLFIEKDAAINQEIERLRHSTTRSLLTRRDTIVVASVSCIYGLGDPAEYRALNLILKVGEKVGRDEILGRLVTMQYERNDIELAPGRFRAKGDIVEVWPSYDEQPLRIELWGEDVDRIQVVHPLTGDKLADLDATIVYPAKHYVSSAGNIERAIVTIQEELDQRLDYFKSVGKLLEAQRIKERTLYDLEMLKVLGYCSGIENYSRHIDGRAPGATPYTMLDYFPDDFITFIDESHVTVPQIGGMANGDRARKQTLVDYGFRLPSAMDNRPLNFDEFLSKTGQLVFVSATPGPFEREVSDSVADQIIRPTGLVDPPVSIHPIQGQVDDLLGRIRERAARGERVLVTTLTKRMSEDLTEYLLEKGVKARYMHSDIDSVERQVIIRDLRLGHYDVLVGINLLREGLDLPEVSLVAILDADKPGFLRSERALIQTIGRAARNVNGEVVLYGDTVTPAMQSAMEETARRREKQLAYNAEHGITPTTVVKGVRDVIRGEEVAEAADPADLGDDRDALTTQLTDLELEMWQASEDLDFERAASLRDQIRAIEAKLQGKEFKQATVPGQKQRTRRKGGVR
ncbi:excinuclease ABC subunit UvrB [Deinococcus metallilatus]|uniref:UvrABC system protein B n=1 Tax=Deinococcus metallilatus TaxID=1211322 RepID=A0AAJ5JXD0_9DEIO|nr:excinuclease ABC subunit UvrB [Deinococcus metallilatus]RXJ09057.1 excinuclease ABC subunit UvrB [Deinococcus metallilatus]TLK21312.1 excinuclease ABC subunit UvrB [Deinococcus metallilatus]